MTYFRAVLVLLSWVTGAVAAGFALFSDADTLTLSFGGVAVVSALAAWGLTLKAEADVERYRAGCEETWSRRLTESQWLDDYFEAHADDGLLLQLPERFDAG